MSIVGVCVLAAGLALLATWGHDWLPVVMQGSDYSMLVTKGISPAVWLLTLVAMASLWHPQQRVVDLWLMLVMWIWLLDIALSAMIGSARFDLGFYVGRLFGLMGASFLLITLLIEMARLQAGTLRAATRAEQRLVELERQQHQSNPQPINIESTNSFISRHNVERYEHLLQSVSEEGERQRILRLLAEERQKQQGADGQPPPDGMFARHRR